MPTFAEYMIAYSINNQNVSKELRMAQAIVMQHIPLDNLTLPKEPHITLYPPFTSSFRSAVKTALEICAAEIKRNEKNLSYSVLHFLENKEGEDELCFEVRSDSVTLREKITELRTALNTKRYLSFAKSEHDGRPDLRLTVCKGMNLANNQSLQNAVHIYNMRTQLHERRHGRHKVGLVVAQIYGKYSNGWQPLSYNPEKG